MTTASTAGACSLKIARISIVPNKTKPGNEPESRARFPPPSEALKARQRTEAHGADDTAVKSPHLGDSHSRRISRAPAQAAATTASAHRGPAASAQKAGLPAREGEKRGNNAIRDDHVIARQAHGMAHRWGCDHVWQLRLTPVGAAIRTPNAPWREAF